MSILYAFIVSGIFCLLAEIILSLTKLTPGHITTLFACIGAILSFFGIYDNLIRCSNMGAIILISNFGNSLYKAGLDGFTKYGFLGIFKNLLNNSSLILSSTIIFSFIFVLLFKSKD